jgi:hypothetical protein
MRRRCSAPVLCAAGACGRGGAAVAVFAWRIHRRHVGSAFGAGGAGGGRAFGCGGDPVEEPLGRGISGVAPGAAFQGALRIYGIYSGLRAEDEWLCALVVIGVNERGEKHFLAIEDGVRESKQSWRELLLDLKERGLTIPPKLAVGDGALGFWAALEEIYPQTRPQRCWVHKVANVLSTVTQILRLWSFKTHHLGGSTDRVGFFSPDQATFELFLEPVRIAADIEHNGVMQQTIQGGGGDHGLRSVRARL